MHTSTRQGRSVLRSWRASRAWSQALICATATSPGARCSRRERRLPCCRRTARASSPYRSHRPVHTCGCGGSWARSCGTPTSPPCSRPIPTCHRPPSFPRAAMSSSRGSRACEPSTAARASSCGRKRRARGRSWLVWCSRRRPSRPPRPPRPRLLLLAPPRHRRRCMPSQCTGTAASSSSWCWRLTSRGTRGWVPRRPRRCAAACPTQPLSCLPSISPSS